MSPGTFTDVTYDVEGGIAVLTLNRPERRNALRLEMMADIEAALEAADTDPEVRALVLTGAGPAFSVGAELAGDQSLITGMIDDAAGHTSSGYREPAGRIVERIVAMRIPVIAAINGDAVGGGATMLAAADLRIAADDARFGFVFTRRGVTPEGASTWLIPRLVGHGRAMDWMVSGRVFDAQEALDAGYVGRVLPAEQVLPAAIEYARQFVDLTSPAAVAHTRRLLLSAWAAPSPTVAAIDESATYAGIVETPDAREGVQSFVERRRPAFESTGVHRVDWIAAADVARDAANRADAG